jgi:SAP domain/CS domain
VNHGVSQIAKMAAVSLIPTLLVLLVSFAQSFLSLPHLFCRRPTGSRPRVPLFGGRGVAPNYTWNEEAFEIEVRVPVPPSTRAKDVRFKATVNSIDLQLVGSDGSSQVLLDPARPLRGRINVDGTYWVLEDSAVDDFSSSVDSTDPSNERRKGRRVAVTIEKLIATPRDDFEVVDYDWKGVYQQDSDVSERTYDKPETLNVREYAASLGVDIDNLNMSMVDKTMFSSGLNLTQSSYDELSKAGLVKEVTAQNDGVDYTVDEEGRAVKFDTYGRGVDEGEIKRSTAKNLPFVDVDASSWQAAVPVYRDPETNATFVKQTRNLTRAAFAKDASASAGSSTPKNTNRKRPEQEEAVDPIDLLTVEKLKEILKSQGLRVSGSKKELQERLRQQVNSLLQGKQDS